MRIPSLPGCVRTLPFNQRQEAMQRAVNAELHSRNICPIMQFWAGNRDDTVGVYRDERGRFWYTSANGEQDEDRAHFLEEVAVDAVCSMQNYEGD